MNETPVETGTILTSAILQDGLGLKVSEPFAALGIDVQVVGGTPGRESLGIDIRTNNDMFLSLKEIFSFFGKLPPAFIGSADLLRILHYLKNSREVFLAIPRNTHCHLYFHRSPLTKKVSSVARNDQSVHGGRP